MIQISENAFTKIVSANNRSFVLRAVYKISGWKGYISDKYVKIPGDRCHVSPNFEECDYTKQNCWTKSSVLDFLETKAKNPSYEDKYVDLGVSKNFVSYQVVAKFKPDQIGWRGYVITNEGEKYVQIDKTKCHVSPFFEDCNDEECWTKNSVLKYLHEIAKKN